MWPTSYWIIAPGGAVDLRSHIQVEGYAASPNRYFLTDVNVQRASLLMLPLRYLPGVRVVEQTVLIPPGVEPVVYDKILVQAMDESQNVAAVVAERAAGLQVQVPPAHIYVAEILPASRVRNVLSVGDSLLTVAGRKVTTSGDVVGIIAHLAVGTFVPISFRHNGRMEHRRVATIHAAVGTRLGIVLQMRLEKANLPVPVRFSLDNISGSSGGLMLALQIYNTLRPDRGHAGRLVAGTGTIAYDGSIGPIEGVAQKVIAAKRIGASVFLLPKQNAAEVMAERGIQIIPVTSFGDALRALGP